MTPTAPGLPQAGDGSGRERLADLALAAALAAIAVSSVVTEDPTVPGDLFPEPNAALVFLALLGSLPLAARRRWPFIVHAIVLASVGVIGALQWNTGLVAACLMFSLYTVAAWRPRQVAVTALVLQYAVTGLLGLLGAAYFDGWMGQLATIGYGIVWLAGRYVRRARLGRHAALQRALEAERTRTITAERAVFAERLRIAREFHDVVSHTLSVIAVQSAVARHLLGPQLGPAAPALTTIEDASRTALNDLRRMLGVLRTEPGDAEASLAPSPGLDELDLLAAAHRSAYGPVELAVDPDVGTAPESVRLTTFRLVQEALTNVRKHAPGAAVKVNVAAGEGSVLVEVHNAGGHSLAQDRVESSGYGLAGMRERVALFGGTLQAGPELDGGYRIRAILHATNDLPVT